MYMKNKPNNILFIVLPYLVHNENTGNNTRSPFVFPYGVLSIVSYIRTNPKNNSNIKILDLNLYTKDEMPKVISQHMETFNPDIVAISMMFDFSYKHLKWVSKQIKDYNSKTIVVVGGTAATVSWDVIPQEQEYLDALCYGEGEYTMQKLIESENYLKTIDEDLAWVTKKSLSKNIIPQSQYVKNLNEVINIDYSLIDINAYGMREAFSPFSSIKNTDKIRQFIVTTSRGCPFRCVFCAVHSFTGRNMRYADVDVLIKHVRYLVENYGMNVLTIYDDQILFNQPRAKDFFRKLAQFKLRVETPNGLSVAFLDDEMARLMKEAGVDTLPLAIESGSPRMLNEVIHKPLRLEQVKPVVESLLKNNIFVLAYFVVGIPSETEWDRDETVRFIKEVGIDWAVFNLATPLRGSDLYKICKENKYINPNFAIGELGMDDYVINAPI